MADRNTMVIFQNLHNLVQAQEHRIQSLLKSMNTLIDGLNMNTSAILNLENRIRALEGCYQAPEEKPVDTLEENQYTSEVPRDNVPSTDLDNNSPAPPPAVSGDSSIK